MRLSSENLLHKPDPYVRLWREVILRAVIDAHSGADLSKMDGENAFRMPQARMNARLWANKSSEDNEISFLTICKMADLPAEAVRKAILESDEAYYKRHATQIGPGRDWKHYSAGYRACYRKKQSNEDQHNQNNV